MKIKRFLILVLVPLLSCKNEKTDIIFQEVSFYVQKDYLKDIEIIKQINSSLSETTSDTIAEINILTNDYFQYLENLQELCSGEKNPFFESGRRSDVSKEGKEFIEKSSFFLSSLKDLLKNSEIKERANLLLNVDDMKYDDKWFIVYIDFYFRGMDCKEFNLLLDYRKRDLLIVQNQILNHYHLNKFHKKQRFIKQEKNTTLNRGQKP